MTFVVADRKRVLRDGDGGLTAAGREVLEVWRRLPQLNPRVVLDELAVVADHVHAVLFLEDHPSDRASLGVVVRRWKAAPTRAIRRTLPGFGWQSHYHDWIIRDQRVLARFRAYIRKNLPPKL